MNTPSKAEARLVAALSRIESRTRGNPDCMAGDIRGLVREAQDLLATLPPQHSSGVAQELLAREAKHPGTAEYIRQGGDPVVPASHALRAIEAALSQQDRPEGAADLIHESLFHLRLDARAEQYHHKAEAFLAALANRSAPDGWVLVRREVLEPFLIVAENIAAETSNNTRMTQTWSTFTAGQLRALASSPSALSGEGVE